MYYKDIWKSKLQNMKPTHHEALNTRERKSNAKNRAPTDS